MNNPQNNGMDEVEQPLTPEAQAAFGKARRSFAVSMGILLLGFMAIAGALVYRVTRDAPAPVVTSAVSLPAGAEVLSAQLIDGRINVTYRLQGAAVLALFDPVSGEQTGAIALGSQ